MFTIEDDDPGGRRFKKAFAGRQKQYKTKKVIYLFLQSYLDTIFSVLMFLQTYLSVLLITIDYLEMFQIYKISL